MIEQNDLFGGFQQPRKPRAARSKVTGKFNGKVGMEHAVDKADRESPKWSERALEEVRRLARIQTVPFTMEQLRLAIVMDEPPDARAWGAVTQAAIRAGYLVKTGSYAPAESSNGSPKPLYRSLG